MEVDLILFHILLEEPYSYIKIERTNLKPVFYVAGT